MLFKLKHWSEKQILEIFRPQAVYLFPEQYPYSFFPEQYLYSAVFRQKTNSQFLTDFPKCRHRFWGSSKIYSAAFRNGRYYSRFEAKNGCFLNRREDEKIIWSLH